MPYAETNVRSLPPHRGARGRPLAKMKNLELNQLGLLGAALHAHPQSRMTMEQPCIERQDLWDDRTCITKFIFFVAGWQAVLAGCEALAGCAGWLRCAGCAALAGCAGWLATLAGWLRWLTLMGFQNKAYILSQNNGYVRTHLIISLAPI